MFFAWVLGFILALALLIALTAAELIVELFELPFETWDVVKEKYEESE